MDVSGQGRAVWAGRGTGACVCSWGLRLRRPAGSAAGLPAWTLSLGRACRMPYASTLYAVALTTSLTCRLFTTRHNNNRRAAFRDNLRRGTRPLAQNQTAHHLQFTLSIFSISRIYSPNVRDKRKRTSRSGASAPRYTL